MDTNGFSLIDAIDCAIDGGYWEQGARDLENCHVDVDFTSIKRSIETSVAGFSPIVPHAIIGLPNSMMNSVKARKPSRVLKIGVNCARPHSVSESEALNRGRAILAVIQYLEQSGYSLELWAYWRNVSRHDLMLKADINVKIKASNERLNVASLAFAICSTAFNRRLCWRFAESCPKSWRLSTKKHRYGFGQLANNSGFDYTFPFSSEGMYYTKEQALSKITQSIQAIKELS
jgi:hypothetical protein